MEEHHVVHEDTEDEFAALRGRVARGERGAEAALVLTEGALDVPALVVALAREPAAALRTAVGRLGPAPARAPRVQRDEALADAEGLVAEPVVRLRVIGGVGEHGVEGLRREQRGRLGEGRGEAGTVVARTRAGDGAEQEVRAGVEDNSELGPRPLPALVARAAADAEVVADVTRFEAGRVDGGDRRGVDQARGARARDHGGLSAAEGPPFSAPARSRRSA